MPPVQGAFQFDPGGRGGGQLIGMADLLVS
jgi:hypothetical protein